MKKNHLITEGLLLLLLSGGAYLGTFMYELGYAAVFGIPRTLIEVNLSTLISVGGAALLVLLLFTQGVSIVASLDREGFFRPENGWGRYSLKWLVALIFVPIAFMVSRTWWTMIPTFCYIFGILFDLFAAYSLRRTDETYNQSLARWLTPLKEDLENKKEHLFRTEGSKKFLNALYAVAFLTVTCALLGTWNAKTTNTYGFVNDNEVILRRYGDNFLIGKFDTSKKLFRREFRLVPASDLKNKIVSRKMRATLVAVEEEESETVP